MPDQAVTASLEDGSSAGERMPLPDADTAATLPAQLTPQWCRELQASMHDATWQGVDATAKAVPPQLLTQLISRATAIFKAEPTLIELKAGEQAPVPAADKQAIRSLGGRKVHIIGDTHGQYHDVCRLFEVTGSPSEEGPLFLFNGDFVDRGAWGVETLTLLLAWKVALPHLVYLVRGNHESSGCIKLYGFQSELFAKYGKADGKVINKGLRAMFALLPLAATVADTALVLHGGLFRKPPPPKTKNRRKSIKPEFQVGTLQDLRSAPKGGQDPSGLGSTVVAADVLWSDPVLEPGLKTNDSRGIGLIFGPDVTEAFLRDNGLRLILRSHEGPDARLQRDDLGPMTQGYTLDHTTPSGNLYTVFSAPDYPQFQDAEEAERYKNKAAVAVLEAPEYAAPTFLQFEAVLPRPKVESYYVYSFPDLSEEEEEEEEASPAQCSAAPSQDGSCSSQGGPSSAPDAIPGAAASTAIPSKGQEVHSTAAGEQSTPCAVSPSKQPNSSPAAAPPAAAGDQEKGPACDAAAAAPTVPGDGGVEAAGAGSVAAEGSAADHAQPRPEPNSSQQQPAPQAPPAPLDSAAAASDMEVEAAPPQAAAGMPAAGAEPAPSSSGAQPQAAEPPPAAEAQEGQGEQDAAAQAACGGGSAVKRARAPGNASSPAQTPQPKRRRTGGSSQIQGPAGSGDASAAAATPAVDQAANTAAGAAIEAGAGVPAAGGLSAEEADLLQVAGVLP